jgi:ribosome-associated protein
VPRQGGPQFFIGRFAKRPAEAEGKENMSFRITSEHIKLDSFLKAVNAVGSGGEAKLIIGEGHVRVNGAVELRRGRKLRPGDRVELDGHAFLVE